MTFPKKILNLYAGAGGNRKLWENVSVIAVENDFDIANIYETFFPDDIVVREDAHEYLLNHYKEYDFIWSSPPCTTHSELKRMGILKGSTKPIYPDLTLYEEIIFLKEYCKKPWIVENVKPYYEYLIKPNYRIGRHAFWCNFVMKPFYPKQEGRIVKTRIKEGRYGFDLTPFKVQSEKGKLKRRVLRNLIDPELGLHILNCAIGELN
ncbi:MAG: DNA cytosine methyltransferase [Candidatus Thorarchaeota archaeon]